MLMKRILATIGLVLCAGALASAQEVTGDRVVVPARNSSRPRLVDASIHNGSLVVKAYNGRDVIVETKGGGNSSSRQRTMGTMKRVEVPPTGLEVEEEDNQITVRLRSTQQEAVVTISVPADTSLKLNCHNGPVDVEGVHGEIDVQSQNGAITLKNVSGTVLASSHNGEVKATMDRLDPNKPISFSSWNGDIDVTLPADFKANVKMKSNRGEIWSDFDVKLTPGQTATQKNDNSKGKFRLTTDRSFSGTINGGGQEASFTTYNGTIMLHRK
jgi:DUF4097 and DUF4098 domain-containing protein YvlB